MSNIFNIAVANLVTPQKRSGTASAGTWPFFNFNLTEGAKKVNTNSSLTVSAFYCAVNTIAESFALLPMSVYQVTDGVRKHLSNHPADYLLYREPNSYMTAFSFKFILAVSALMKGNGYALILRDNSGNIASYNYLDPYDVTVIVSGGKLFYKYKNEAMYSAEEIIHVPNFSFDGISGKSVLEHAADNIGVSLAAQKFGSDALGDRGLGYGVLESELNVAKEKKVEISNAFESRLSTGGKFRAPLLDEGMKYKSITLSPAEAQFIQTYAAGIGDIARWFRIPLHKLHVSGEGGYNFLVQMSIEYLQSAVMPLGEKFKQEFERKTFTASERKNGIYIFQNYKKLLQADPKARAQFYKDLYFIGAINADEVRGYEDLNPRPDGKGQEFLQPANMLNIDQLKKQVQDEN